ncbi:hypothetical protein C8R45DRAFT_1133326 [Mycena sanguinolenta]|nr:hypothetical protein C8R45DRAFT_1133326 [Mycena sanguinolenta]
MPLYSKLLSSPSRGYAVSRPSPPDDGLPSVRESGVVLADVCIMHKDCSLERICNPSRPQGDILNSSGVPEGLKQLILNTSDDTRKQTRCYRPGSTISNAVVRKKTIDARLEGGGAATVMEAAAVLEFHTDSSQAAILYLPDGASDYDLRRESYIRQYVLHNRQKFVDFAQRKLGRTIGDEGLFFVTGLTKAPAWCIAMADRSQGGGSVSLRLKASPVGGARTSCSWDWENASSSMYSGPHRGPGEESWGENQTIFIRGYRIVPSRIGAPNVIAVGQN